MDSILQWLHKYMVSGILQAGIVQDGGQQCYDQIPKKYHIFLLVSLSIVHIIFLKKFEKTLQYEHKVEASSLFQKIFAFVSFISYIITFYFKVTTRKGIFMLNPCHMTLLIQIYLLIKPSTKLNQKIHTMWTSWLFGAYMAIMIPHIQGIGTFQIYLYFVEHMAIIPFGYFILSRRYTFVKPTFKNQLAAFSSLALYQFLILGTFSIITMANLNFALCHTPADPLFPYVKEHYFAICTVGLNVISFIFRYLTYLQVKLLTKIKVKLIKPKTQ